ITVNVAQLHDPAFRAALEATASRQREVHRAAIEAEERAKYDEWSKTPEALEAIEPGKKAQAFERHVEAKTAERLKAGKAIQVDARVPAGTGGKTIVVEVPGIDIVPRETAIGEGGSYVAKDAFGTTVIDKSFGETAEAQAKKLRADPKASIEVGDVTSS